MVSNVFAKSILLTPILSLIVLAAPIAAQEAVFTDLTDLIPDRCFSAPLTTVTADSVHIGIESGFSFTTWINKACKASTSAFHARSVADTFTATVTAPPGMRIARVHYQQVGDRYLERSTYWQASGTGSLTANGVTLPFSFTLPTLVKTLDFADQYVESTTVSVMIRLAAGRSSNFPRVTAPPGSARIEATDAVIRVEFQ